MLEIQVPTDSSNSLAILENQIFFEQYKLYVDMVEHSIKRRMDTNTLFISIHTAMVTIVSLLNKGNPWALLAVAASGIAFSILWRVLLKNYNAINNAKWEVIYDMEQCLPYKPFYGEWYEELGYKDEKGRQGNPNKKGGEGKPSRSAMTPSILEKALPWFFGCLYVVIGIAALCILAKGGVNAAGLSATVAELQDAVSELTAALADITRAGIAG